jgi:archaemetzincin
MKAARAALLLAAVLLPTLAPGGDSKESEKTPAENDYRVVEDRLTPLAKLLGPPRPGEWLDNHKEDGQTFRQYVDADPVRRGPARSTIYLCLLGDFTPAQQRVLDATREYLRVFFDAPVTVHKRVPLKDVPGRARRVHPKSGDSQVLTTYVLDELLKPERPDDALAYVAFTSSDLWPGEGWNFVFGQASLRERTGVWSIYRLGDPAAGDAWYSRCLQRTLGTASHEIGHILTMEHCTTYECSMNGSDSLEESDRKPLHLCPTCLRKVCWNLRVEPTAYLERLRRFCAANGLEDEREWYRRASEALRK